jgi:hypothetical protein
MVPLKSHAKFGYKSITSYWLPTFPPKPFPLTFVPLECFHACFVTLDVDLIVD